MAGLDEVTHIELDGAEEMIAQFTRLGEAAEEAYKSIEQSASKVSGAGEHIKKMAEDGKKSLGELGVIGAEAFGKILDAAGSGNFVPLIGMFSKTAAAIGEVVEKAISFVEAQASVVETLSNLGAATGMTLSQIEGLKDAFASVGISTNGFERAIGRLAITISNEWSQIQQSVRTSADAQTGAMLHIKETALGVEKAYNAMGEALDNSSRSAAHNALNIESAALGLRRAGEALQDFALQSQHNTLSIESAQLALTRAKMNLAKDQGFAVNPADEKALKIAQDQLQVKEAELRLRDAQQKKAKEALEMEELQLKVKKAKQEMDDAEHKRIEDSVKASERIKESELAIQKAKLASREASEKAHEQDLKDIPQIAREITNVANGYKKWDEVMNHAEISAQNLTKAVILSASAGDMSKQPTAMQVFEKMVEIFPKITDEGQKLALVQHTMGAGFRAGQASAAQMLAVMERGPEALKHFMHEAEAFSKVKIGGFDTFADQVDHAGRKLSNTEVALKNFNSAFSQLDAAIDSVKNRFAAILSVPLTEMFTNLKNSIYENDGVLRKFSEAFGNGLKVIADGASAVVSWFKRFEDSTGFFSRLIELAQRLGSGIADIVKAVTTLLGSFEEGQSVGSRFMQMVVVAMGVAKFAVDALRLSLAGVLIAIGTIGAAYDRVFGKAKSFDEALKNSAIFQTGKNMAQSAFKDASADVGQILKDAAKKEEGAGEKLQGAAERQNEAAGASRGAADKHSSAADKLEGAAGTVATRISEGGEKLQTAAANLTDAAKAIADAAGRLGQKTGSAATGGHIRGPGGPKDDKAGLFALSDGEYVVQSDAVSHYGVSLFEALNNLAVGGFATGGAVGASAPKVSSGATGGSPSILNLTIDGNHFNGLKAPDSVAAKLKSYAVSRQTSAAQKMPTWMR